MRYRFFTNSERAWDAMLAAIDAASESIYWECYILLDDTVSHGFFDLLERKARAGVRVKIVVDRIGSWSLYDHWRVRLKSAGAELLYFNQVVPWWNRQRFHRWWFLRNHRKVLILDERIAFVGGVNVGEAYRQWFDLHLKLQGLVVRPLLHAFIRSYRMSGGNDKQVVAPAHWRKKFISRAKVFSLSSWSGRHSRTLEKYYLRACAHAQKRIIIITPYFFPHRWLLLALSQAHDRGVSIEIILPRQTDHWFLRAANEVFALEAVKRGFQVMLTNEMHHAKAIIVDEREAMIGSNNIDAQSFDFNLEGNVVFKRRDMLVRLEVIVDHWRRGATPFLGCRDHSTLRHWLCYKLFLLLQPLL